MNKWLNFTNKEIYILGRQAIIASFEIIMGDTYNTDEQKTHDSLLNALSTERRRRGNHE